MQTYVGTDLGGATIDCALARASGELLAERSTATQSHEGPEVVLGRIADAVNDFGRGVEVSPAALGMGDYEADDGLYFDLLGQKPIEVLASARSKVTGNVQPIVFVHKYGPPRVFDTTLGHDVKAINAPGTSKRIRRGAAWAAGKL